VGGGTKRLSAKGAAVDPGYERHIFVCTSGSTCPLDGDAVGVQKTLKKRVAERPELKGRVRVNQSGCLNQCGHGPMMVVYPENVWYWRMTPEKAAEVFERHLLGGEPVEAYRYRNTAGDHKLPRDESGRVTADPCHPGRQDLGPGQENAPPPKAEGEQR
jgi:(2Fe-2S) ferredoxin